MEYPHTDVILCMFMFVLEAVCQFLPDEELGFDEVYTGSIDRLEENG